MLIQCPSGLTGEAREIRGQEMSDMADRAEGAGGNIFAPVVRACWEKTSDSGPYPFIELGDTKVDFARVATDDLLYALLQLRIHSLGKEGHLYHFPVKCTGCGEKYQWTVDLAADLVVKPIREDVKKTLLSGGPFSANVAGKRVEYDIRRVAQMEALRAEMKRLQRRRVSEPEMIGAQLLRVEGLKSQDRRSLYRFALDLAWSDVLDLYEEMQAISWGYNLLDLQVLHKECGEEQDIIFPFGRTFFRHGKSSQAKADEQASTGTPSASAGFSQG